jgi:hypothetical protein
VIASEPKNAVRLGTPQPAPKSRVGWLGRRSLRRSIAWPVSGILLPESRLPPSGVERPQAKQAIIGTIIGGFDGVLNGLPARLVRRRKFGYTVELVEARGRWQAGTLVHLSFAEFLIPQERTGDGGGAGAPGGIPSTA